MITADEIIDALGGTSAVAGLCGLTTGCISQWRVSYEKDGTTRRLSAEEGIPRSWLMFFKASRPDLFGLTRKSRTNK